MELEWARFCRVLEIAPGRTAEAITSDLAGIAALRRDHPRHVEHLTPRTRRGLAFWMGW